MLLSNELVENVEQHQNDLIAYMQQAKEVRTKRITYFYDSEFGSGINVYICKKSSELNPAGAFMALWLKNALWEEELTDFDYSRKQCTALFEDVFLSDVEDYELKEIQPEAALRYMGKKIKLEMDKIKKSAPAHIPADVGFLDISGVYINRVYTDKTPSMMNKDDEIINCVQLSANKDFGDYRELFMETRERYIFFF